MSSKVATASASVPVRSLENIRRPSEPLGRRSDFVGPDYVSVTHAAVLDYYGSVKATAYALGEGAGQPKLDESLMQREFKAGDFKRLRSATSEALGAMVKAPFAAFGPLAASPQARARQLIRESRALLDELDQAVEAIA